MEVIEQLQQLGFSQYEAQAYVALLRKSPLNGYELAKTSGIPRPNIYAVLQRLEESGAVLRISTPDGTRYVPVPAQELLANLHWRYQESLSAVGTSLQQITTPPQEELVLNLRGYATMIDQARALIDQTRQYLLFSIWPEEAIALAEPVRQAQARGVRITTLCLRGCPQPCPACQGEVFRYAIAPSRDARWLVVVADGSELLAGEILPIAIPSGAPAGYMAAAIRTRQQMLVSLTGSYVHNSIALATILTQLNHRLYTELDPQLLAALNDLHPLHAPGGWLERMRQALNLENNLTTGSLPSGSD